MNLKLFLECGNRCGCSEPDGSNRCSAEEDCCTCSPCKMCDHCAPKGGCARQLPYRIVDETCMANSTAPNPPGEQQTLI